MKFERALVTGGAGFIGSNLVDKLISQGKEVCVVDNLYGGRKINIQHHFTNSRFCFFKENIQDPAMSKVFRIFRPNVVFHLAAVPGVSYSVEQPEATNLTNCQGTVNLLELSNQYKVQKFIFSSSSSVYGGSEDLPTAETTPLNPKSPYALQKKISEEYCKLFSNIYDLDTVSLRYFNVFGPRQQGNSPYSSVISSFAHSIVMKKSPIIYGDGNQFRDFCYIDNVVQANILAAEHKNRLNGEVFNIGCGGETSVNELARIMKTLTPEYKDRRAGDVDCSQADIQKAKDVLGYKILVPFNKGIEKTLRWYTGE